MSLERTQSIVGSEVEPLDYGRMDTESSPSPTSSEETVEGVRGDEVVEVGGVRWQRLGGMRALASWKAKRANQNKFSLTEDEEEEVGRLMRKRGDVLNIMDLTSAACIEAAELYGPSALTDMNQFLDTAGGKAIPKKPRKKSRTSTKQVDEGRTGKEIVPTASAETGEEVPPLKRKGWEERRVLEKKKKVVEEEKGNEVPLFVPQPPPVELNLELRRLEEGAEVVHQQHLPRSGPKLRAGGSSEAWWSVRCEARSRERELGEWSSPGIQGEPEGVRTLAETERSSLGTKLGFEETKRKISESERDALAQELKLTKEAFLELKGNVQTLVHNGMKEHIGNFISSSSFDNIVNLYRLPTAIIAFTDCRKKVKTIYPEVDVTRITFGEQEAGVEEDGESMSADFRPEIKLKWDHDADGLTVFPPNFDFEFVAVEEEDEAEVEGGGVEAGADGAEVDKSQPAPEVEIHPVPSDDDQPPLPDEQQLRQPPLPAEEKPVEPPPPAEN
ncbi:hypothetical protein SLEP1_g55752 [Rubroshorea leprosula]|uniref:Uncharacterized protein n=1 Tax=Rubroshorea leprosula TaxID=152421 RepID=A0AAV5MGQ7_9ROSI|nr:hypothetical protein SLEP1_g55752 [Rubroshorea leprosula]